MSLWHAVMRVEENKDCALSVMGGLQGRDAVP